MGKLPKTPLNTFAKVVKFGPEGFATASANRGVI